MNIETFIALAPVINREYVPIKFIVDHFEINAKSASAIVKRDPKIEFATANCRSKLVFGDEKERICIRKSAFIRFIQLLTPSMVAKEKQEELMEFQIWIVEYLYQGASNYLLLQRTQDRINEIDSIVTPLLQEKRLLKKGMYAEVQEPGGMQRMLASVKQQLEIDFIEPQPTDVKTLAPASGE